MRDVAVVSYSSFSVAREPNRNEVEIIVPVIHDAIAASGIPKAEIGFVCSGSIDYLFGGPFAFVAGVDAVGAVPPIRESHVEMDAAWALYEAWCYIQTGEIDSALIYGFSKASICDPYEVMTMQTDPYYTIPLWPSTTDMAGLSARAYLDRTGHSERDLAEVAARAQRNGATNPLAVRADAKADADALLASSPYISDPLRECDVYPVSDGAVALVIAAEDVARNVSKRPAWIRGIDHRIDAHSLGVRDLSVSESTRLAGEHAGATGAFDVAELHAQYSHEELLLAETLGLDRGTDINPSGGPLATNVIMGAGLSRIGEVAQRITSGSANRGVAHATSGPCLQQNLVCVLEGDK